MASRREVEATLLGVNERIEALRARIVAGADRTLPSGTWTVRDALCHLAARSNGVPNFVARIERLAQGAPGGAAARPAGFNIDEINQGQIDARAGHSVDQLLDEIIAGHRGAVEALATVDEALLSRMVPSFRGDGDIEAAAMLLGGTANHDNNHLSEIEQALA